MSDEVRDPDRTGVRWEDRPNRHAYCDGEIARLRRELAGARERLAAAETVCVLFGWTSAHDDTDREKALTMLWRRWSNLVGNAFTSPGAHPELSDEVIASLARERDAIRERTLAKLRYRSGS
jgi:hypothetical protein